MGLCTSCRMLADKLAEKELSPDGFRLGIGNYAKMFGHDAAHKEIRERYHKMFGVIGLDEFIAGTVARQPMSSITPKTSLEVPGYKHQFAVQSNWDNEKNQRTYHYYTQTTDDSFWIVIMRKNKDSKITEEKVILGSFNNYDSRISKIWRATQVAGKHAADGKFVRKWVEDLDPESCGNNRIPSGAAFRLFKHLGLIELVEVKGKTEYYRLTRMEPDRKNLDRFMQSMPKLVSDNLPRLPIINHAA